MGHWPYRNAEEERTSASLYQRPNPAKLAYDPVHESNTSHWDRSYISRSTSVQFTPPPLTRDCTQSPFDQCATCGHNMDSRCHGCGAVVAKGASAQDTKKPTAAQPAKRSLLIWVCRFDGCGSENHWNGDVPSLKAASPPAAGKCGHPYSSECTIWDMSHILNVPN